jgi:hypothetical protein
MHIKKICFAALVPCIFLVFIGFSTVGPRSVERDRPGYNDAISESMKAQTLLNMVKLRYGDMPLFLDVSSIINSYSLEGTVNLDTGFTFGHPNVEQNMGVDGFCSDRPTITDSPLVGNKPTKSLLVPIPPAAVFFLVQSGVPD